MLKIYCHLCIFLLLAIVLNVSAFAQGFDPNKIEDIPTYKDKYSIELFERDSRLYKEIPFGDKYLAYEVLLPRDWSKSEDHLNTSGRDDDVGMINAPRVSRRLLGEVARYYGPSGLRAPARLEILAIELEHEITARNWFLHHVFRNGFTLQGMKVVSDRRVEGMYVVLERGTLAYKVRMVAEINGPRVIMATHFQPERNLSSEMAALARHEGGVQALTQKRKKELIDKLSLSYYTELAQQEYAMESFKFLNPEKAQVELTRTYSFLDLLSFDYPASWRLVNPEIYDVTEMSATIMNTFGEETLSGEIKISVISTELDTDIPTEISYINEDLEARHLFLKEVIEKPTKFITYDHIFFDATEVYTLDSRKQKILAHEFWISILVEDRYFYFVTMISPGRNVDFYNWARNTEAFEKVVETMRPHE